MRRRLTRRQFLNAAGASAIAALLDACGVPGPALPDEMASPLATPSRYTVYLPRGGADATPTPAPTSTSESIPTPQPPEPTSVPRRTLPVFDRPSKLGI